MYLRIDESMFSKVTAEEINSLSESVNDIRYSWRLFRENARAFLATEVFAIIGSAIFIALLIGLLFVFDKLRLDDNIYIWTTVVFMLIIVTVFNILLTAQYGLAYDIFSSGDMYAEFKGVFVYFRRSWWRYLVVLILFNIISPTVYINSDEEPARILSIYIFIALLLIDFIGFTILVNVLPGISNHNNLRLAFRENFSILRRYPRRHFTTWALFYLIFKIPMYIYRGISLFVNDRPHDVNFLIYSIPFIIIMLAIETIRFPMAALVSTRIYNLLEEDE